MSTPAFDAVALDLTRLVVESHPGPSIDPYLLTDRVLEIAVETGVLALGLA